MEQAGGASFIAELAMTAPDVSLQQVLIAMKASAAGWYARDLADEVLRDRTALRKALRKLEASARHRDRISRSRPDNRRVTKRNLIVLAGRPGMGKSALALNITAYTALHAKRGAAYFTLEMTRSEITLRLLASEARIDSLLLRAPRCSSRISFRSWSRFARRWPLYRCGLTRAPGPPWR